MRQLLIIPFLILLQINVFSQNTIHISNTQDLVKVGKDVLFLEDVAGDLSFEDILKEENQIKFKKNNHDVFSRPAMKSAFWFKFIIQNQSQESIWLEIGDTFSCWNLDFYAPDRNNQYPEPLLLGSLRPQKNKQFPSKYYCVELTKGKQTNAKVYYLKTYGSSKVQGNLTKTHVFRVGGVKALAKQAMTYDYMQSFFMGLMITMIITSLFILFSTREKTYLLYVFYLVNVLIVVSFVTSAPLFYHRWFWEYNYVWMSAFYFSVSLFTIHTLSLKHDAPNLNRWIWVLTIVLCIIIPLLNLFNLVNFILLTNTFQVTVGVYYFTLFYCGIYVWRKGNKGARF
jgi:hypothetical protein